MSYQKIHCVNHIGKNLLIVGYDLTKQWCVRIVTKEGHIVKEADGFTTPQIAEKEGQDWIVHNLPLN